jgi:hypothetical protein
MSGADALANLPTRQGGLQILTSIWIYTQVPPRKTRFYNICEVVVGGRTSG